MQTVVHSSDCCIVIIVMSLGNAYKLYIHVDRCTLGCKKTAISIVNIYSFSTIF